VAIVETNIPSYVSGTWEIDPGGSSVGFVVRHLMIAKVFGQLESVHGEIVTAADQLDSSVTVAIDAASFHTSEAAKNEHVMSPEFLDVKQYPTITFNSTGVRLDLGLFLIEGELTIRGVTRTVTLNAAPRQFGPNQSGAMSLGVSAHARIRRSDFGVSLNAPLARGGLHARRRRRRTCGNRSNDQTVSPR
jgi:polyisoprenoid-binding protein YceI